MPRPTLAPPSTDQLATVRKLARQPVPVWRAELQLKTITPVVGGGVKSSVPDKIDFVRAPTIKGQLRHWWRMLYSQHGESTDDLFRREAELWGGVAVPDADSSKDDRNLRSLVRITTEVKPSEASSPRDVDQLNSGYRYALFGQTMSEGEAGKIRPELRFRLTITAIDSQRNSEVLSSLWAWLLFSGIGSRTHRGFGTLQLRDQVRFDAASASLQKFWKDLLPSTQVIDPIPALANNKVHATNPAWPPSLAIGPQQGLIDKQHRYLIQKLAGFRKAKAFPRSERAQRGSPIRFRLWTVQSPRRNSLPTAKSVVLAMRNVAGVGEGERFLNWLVKTEEFNKIDLNDMGVNNHD